MRFSIRSLIISLVYLLFSQGLEAFPYKVPVTNRDFSLLDKPFAIVSGAGLSGLSSALVLRDLGFEVLVLEARTEFNRANIINLTVETQDFFKSLGLLEKFESSVGSRIGSHTVYQLTENDDKIVNVDDTFNTQILEATKFDADRIPSLFSGNGIYSIQIAEMQDFLAKEAENLGVNFLPNSKIEGIDTSENISLVIQDKSTGQRLFLFPEILVIAEGVHSETLDLLKIEAEEKNSSCSGERWVFANANYKGSETFVFSFVNSLTKDLQIGNVIFNSHLQTANIAVTYNEGLSIQEQIESLAKEAFRLAEISELNFRDDLVTKIVEIRNRRRPVFAVGNVLIVGDSGGNSSPLAGAGGSIGLSVVPSAVREFASTYANNPRGAEATFNGVLSAAADRWIEKSASVKSFILGLHAKLYKEDEYL